MNNRQAIGFIEAAGLPAAIAAADAAAKSADVSVIGRENTKGGGLITVKINGDVSAVKAALEAAKAASDRVRSTHSVLVIARPGKEIPETFGSNRETFYEQGEKTVCDEPQPTPEVKSEMPAEQTEEPVTTYEESAAEAAAPEEAASDEAKPEEGKQGAVPGAQDTLKDVAEDSAEPQKKQTRPRGRK